MDPITASLVIGGVGLVGGMLANDQSAKNTASANATSLQSSREQMAFQEKMSNSAYQRATQDMTQAGLNPMLAYSQGGASTPSGASMTAQTADYKDPISPAMSSAVQAQSTLQNLKTQEVQTVNDSARTTATVALQKAQAVREAQSAKTEVIRQQSMTQDLDKKKVESDFYKSEPGKLMYKIDKFSESIGGVLDNVNAAKILFGRPKPKPGTGRTKDGTTFNLNTGEVMP